MPTFIDRHPFQVMPTGVRHQLLLEVRHQLRDARGLRPLGQWIEDETIYCVVEAPNDHAVCEHHAERGLPCDDLHAITDLEGQYPLSERDQAVVRAAIERLWHSRGAR